MDAGATAAQPNTNLALEQFGELQKGWNYVYDSGCLRATTGVAQDCDRNSREGKSSSWDHAPQEERKLIVAAPHLALLELAATPPTQSTQGRKYCAKPGEADWGC